MKLRRFLALLLVMLLCVSLTACGEKEPEYSPTTSPYAMKWEGNMPQVAAENGEILIHGGIAALARELNIGRTSLYRTLEQLEQQKKIVKRNRKWFREGTK